MSSLDDDDLRELAKLLLLSQKVNPREALCLRIGIKPYDLTFIRDGAERDFVIQLINYLNQINDEEALCRLCCQELSLTFHRGEYASVLKKILVKLNCSQFRINPPTNHLENITFKNNLFLNKKNLLIIFALILSAISSYFLLRLLNFGVEYQAYVANNGWQNPVFNGATAGTTKKSLRMEAIRISLTNAPSGTKICYKVHVANNGWQGEFCDGAEAGTTGEGRQMEAIKIRLVNPPSGAKICYKVHIANIGWQDDDVCDDTVAGTIGESRQMEAIQIKVKY